VSEANAGKALTVQIEGTSFARIPIRTRVVMPGDDLDAFVRQYATDVVKPGDILFVTEKIVAITQGRSYLVEDITPRRLALFLARHQVTDHHFPVAFLRKQAIDQEFAVVGEPLADDRPPTVVVAVGKWPLALRKPHRKQRHGRN
jgi:hypothetical protein